MGIQSLTEQLIHRGLFQGLKSLFHLWRRSNRYCSARLWSNDELRKFAKLFSGDVINVSAGNDKDKENGYYRDYFANAKSYSISNYRKVFNDNDHLYHEIELDLSIPLSPDSDIVSEFDAVFSHTVLEHIFDVKTAVENLCRISKDIVISVIPFIQSFHHDESVFHDYWRFSPYAIINLFNEHSFKTVYINWNNDPVGNIYIFHIASKHPDRWCDIKMMNNDFGPGYYRQLLLSSTDNCRNGKISTLNKII